MNSNGSFVPATISSTVQDQAQHQGTSSGNDGDSSAGDSGTSDDDDTIKDAIASIVVVLLILAAIVWAVNSFILTADRAVHAYLDDLVAGDNASAASRTFGMDDHALLAATTTKSAFQSAEVINVWSVCDIDIDLDDIEDSGLDADTQQTMELIPKLCRVKDYSSKQLEALGLDSETAGFAKMASDVALVAYRAGDITYQRLLLLGKQKSFFVFNNWKIVKGLESRFSVMLPTTLMANRAKHGNILIGNQSKWLPDVGEKALMYPGTYQITLPQSELYSSKSHITLAASPDGDSDVVDQNGNSIEEDFDFGLELTAAGEKEIARELKERITSCKTLNWNNFLYCTDRSFHYVGAKISSKFDESKIGLSCHLIKNAEIGFRCEATGATISWSAEQNGRKFIDNEAHKITLNVDFIVNSKGQFTVNPLIDTNDTKQINKPRPEDTLDKSTLDKLAAENLKDDLLGNFSLEIMPMRDEFCLNLEYITQTGRDWTECSAYIAENFLGDEYEPLVKSLSTFSADIDPATRKGKVRMDFDMYRIEREAYFTDEGWKISGFGGDLQIIPENSSVVWD